MWFITRRTNPNLARAKIQAWQSELELRLYDEIADVVKRAQARGLETKRIGKVLSKTGSGLEQIGGGKVPPDVE